LSLKYISSVLLNVLSIYGEPKYTVGPRSI